MKADTFIKLLRKVIREEVQQVVREELGLLLETPEPKKTVTEPKAPVKNSMVESIKPKQPSKPINFANNNILNEILNDTAHAGEWKSLANMNSSAAQGFGPIGNYSTNEPAVVNSVDQMLSSARPAGDVTHVQIDAVPDFSGLMKTMKEKGQI